MQSETQPLGLTKPVQGRALRLIQALITAAEARGHSTSAGRTGFAPPSHRRRRASPHFTITARGQTVGFLVLQEQDRTEHVATEKDLAAAKKDSWVRIPRFDGTPSERLRFVLSGGQPHLASEWAETPGRSLEEQLAEKQAHPLGSRHGRRPHPVRGGVPHQALRSAGSGLTPRHPIDRVRKRGARASRGHAAGAGQNRRRSMQELGLVSFNFLQRQPPGTRPPPGTTCTISQMTSRQNERHFSVTSVISASRYRP